jgi:hypothetical protein
MSRTVVTLAGFLLLAQGRHSSSLPEVPAADRAKKLEELGMVAYPAAPRSRLSSDLVKVRPLASDPPDAGFTNLDDLAWLEPIARRSRVVLLGETHYAATTYQLVARILFALNTFDHYALSLELPYSLGAFFHHYAGIADDDRAQDFRRDVLSPLVFDQETIELLEHIRRWNRGHPKKRIAVGAHDLEHNASNVLRTIIAPAFAAAKLDCPLPSSMDDDELGSVVKTLRGCLARTRTGSHFGPHPFVTTAYLGAVIDNLQSTYERRQSGEVVRQRAIIRNLTDRRFFLPLWRDDKLLWWGGDAHAQTRVRPAVGALRREGAYFNFEYPPTRGRTHSVHIFAYALAMGAMAGTDLRAYNHVGQSYRSLVERFGKAERAGLATPEESFLYDWTPDDLDYMWLAQARAHGDHPILIEAMDWKDAASQASAIDPDLRRGVANWQAAQAGFDSFIVVPKSPITRAVPRPFPP